VSEPKKTIEATQAAAKLISSRGLTSGHGIDDAGVARGLEGDQVEHRAGIGANLQDTRSVNISSNVFGAIPPLPTRRRVALARGSAAQATKWGLI